MVMSVWFAKEQYVSSLFFASVSSSEEKGTLLLISFIKSSKTENDYKFIKISLSLAKIEKNRRIGPVGIVPTSNLHLIIC